MRWVGLLTLLLLTILSMPAPHLRAAEDLPEGPHFKTNVWEMTVHAAIVGAQFGEPLDWGPNEEGRQFVLVTLRVQNLSSTDQVIKSNQFGIVDGDDVVTADDDLSKRPDPLKIRAMGERDGTDLKPGENEDFILGWRVSPDLNAFVLEFDADTNRENQELDLAPWLALDIDPDGLIPRADDSGNTSTLLIGLAIIAFGALIVGWILVVGRNTQRKEIVKAEQVRHAQEVDEAERERVRRLDEAAEDERQRVRQAVKVAEAERERARHAAKVAEEEERERVRHAEQVAEAERERVRHAQDLGRLLVGSGADFERSVGSVLASRGYSLDRTGRAGDRGVDLRGTSPDGSPVIVQCKRYGLDNKVGSLSVQAFIGSIVNEGATCGVFVTTSVFTQEALRLGEQSRVPIWLVNGQTFTAMARSAAHAKTVQH